MTTEPGADPGRTWWENAVLYQIFPKSFKDTDGDGVGDLQGIVEKLDYLQELGVDGIWINPIYESPGVDGGYDVSDFTAIDPQYGTMDDFDELLAEAHARDIRVIMDLIPNHTSDEHEWFQRSRREVVEDGRDYADFYIWRDGLDPDEAHYYTEDGPEDEVAPNDWGSFFGGPAWTYDELREQWYLHLFDPKQPDLNWEEPTVREAVYDDAVRFWLEKGVDGFRLDAIVHLSKEPGLPHGGYDQFTNGPRLREFLRELLDVVHEYEDVVTIGEMGGTTPEAADAYGEDGVDLIIEMATMNALVADPFHLEGLKEALNHWQNALETVRQAIHLENHDRDRVVSRIGDDEQFRVESAKMLGTLLMTLRGTPIVYQGQEIGMTNTVFDTLEETQDPSTMNVIRGRLGEESYETLSDARKAEVGAGTRANARTPIQWTDDEHAGFTDGEPWLRVNPNYPTVNVERELADENSVLQHYRDLVKLREEHPVLRDGDYYVLDWEHPTVFGYTRSTGDPAEPTGEETIFVLMNVSGLGPVTEDGEDEVWFELPDEVEYDVAELLSSNYEAPRKAEAGEIDKLSLRPWEARVYRLVETGS
jgi:glycosidase